jgi:hypothetical protein
MQSTTLRSILILSFRLFLGYPSGLFSSDYRTRTFMQFYAATLSTTNSAWPDLGLNPGPLRWEVCEMACPPSLVQVCKFFWIFIFFPFCKQSATGLLLSGIGGWRLPPQ